MYPDTRWRVDSCEQGPVAFSLLEFYWPSLFEMRVEVTLVIILARHFPPLRWQFSVCGRISTLSCSKYSWWLGVGLSVSGSLSVRAART